MRQEAPVNISNVMLLDPKSNEPTRVGKAAIIDENTGKTRYVRRSVATGETIE
jgi:large subunit ribosomal protein L24